MSAGASTPRQTARKCWGVSPTTATAAAPVHPPGSGAQSDPSTPFAEAWASPRSTPPWKGVVGDQTPFTPPQLAAVPGDGPEDAQSGGSSAPRSADEVRGAPVWEDVGGSPALSTPRRQFSAPSGVTTPSDGGSLSTPQPPGEEKARKGVALFFGEESSFGDEVKKGTTCRSSASACPLISSSGTAVFTSFQYSQRRLCFPDPLPPSDFHLPQCVRVGSWLFVCVQLVGCPFVCSFAKLVFKRPVVT